MRGKIFSALMRAVRLSAPMALVACGSAQAGSAREPVVVELFTSQGCSSCPPANANLVELSRRDDVLALSFGVTYWDYLGWKDIFAKPEFTDRQVTYAGALGHSAPFTPQMVIDGKADTVGNRLPAVERLIAGAEPRDGPDMALQSGRVTIAAGAAPSHPADIWLVHYKPGTVDVPVGRGENGGRTLPHANVVHRLARIGKWTGDAVSLDLAPPAAGLSAAVLVQMPRGGAILAAARDRPSAR